MSRRASMPHPLRALTGSRMRHRHLPRPRRVRRALAFAGLASVAAGLVLLPAAAPSMAGVTAKTARAAGSSSGTTVKGPRLFNGNITHPGQLPSASTVTVTPTSNLVNQLVTVSWANFTPSTEGGSQGIQPWYSANSGAVANWAVMVVECKGTSPASPADCYQASTAGVPQPNASPPSNAQYAVTTPEGAGQVPFDVENSQTNKQLGCDQDHPCSLVVVPGQGGANGNCNNHKTDVGNTGNAAPINTFPESGTSCSWGKRIVVPLHFAPEPASCPARNAAFSVTGSPMLADAMQQWQTGLCAGKNGLTLSYAGAAGEPLAVSEEASGATDVALTTRPASADGVGGKRSFVYAPVAVSAAAIAYWMDNTTTGQTMSGLKLNQRLLAKLLTTSYNPDFTDDKGVQGNPFFIFSDPEFQQLDPQIAKNGGGGPLTYVVPTVPGGLSDLTWTVTRWIGANPTASAFLQGTPAPGKMHVNTFYKGLKYPVDQFTAQDPSPEYTRLYNPVQPFSRVVTFQALSQDSGSNTPSCTGTDCSFSQDPAEPVGDRALVAILDEGDAALDHLPVAAIPNAAGKYVQPTNAAMAAALSHMTSAGNGTLQVNLANTDPAAYPLTMVSYAMVPASGLPHAKATAIARFLDFVAGPGQTPGLQPGQLPPGYLPLPASMRAQTKKLASEIAKETAGTPQGPSGGGGGGGTGGTNTGTGGGTGGSQSGTGSSGSSSGSGSSQSTTAKHAAAAGAQPVSLVSAAQKPSAITRFVLPALLLFGGAAAVGGSFALAGAGEGGIPGNLRRLRRRTVAWSGTAFGAIAGSRRNRGRTKT